MTLDIIMTFEWITLGCSFFLLHPKNTNKVQLLISVMVIIVAAESLGYYFRHVLHIPNHTIYNASVPLVIINFLLLYILNYAMPGNRKKITIALVLFTIFCTINLVWLQGMSRFSAYNYVAGTITLIFATVLYFSELIRIPTRISIRKEQMFWISAAILLLYLPKSILYSVFEYLVYKQETSVAFAHSFHFINKIVNVIYFSLLSYASLCRLIYRV
jgi:hypothetical protein